MALPTSAAEVSGGLAPQSDASQAVEVAQLVIEWAAVVLGLVGFILALLAVLGVGELRRLRLRHQEAQELRDQMVESIQQIDELRQRWDNELHQLDSRLDRLIEAAYLFNEGERAYARGDYPLAVDRLRSASEIEPKNVHVLFRLGRALTNLGKDAEAAQAFTTAAAFASAGAELGEIERGLAVNTRYSSNDAALEHAQRAVQADPSDVKNWNFLGLLHRDAGNVDKSLHAHTKALELEPSQPITHFYLLLMCLKKGSMESARRHIEAAVAAIDDQAPFGRIKPLWESVVRWAAAIHRGDYKEGNRLMEVVCANVTSRRRSEEVIGHVEYLLRGLGREDYIDRYTSPLRVVVSDASQ